MTDVSYVYALIRSDGTELPALPAGIDEQPVRRVDSGRIGALVSSVDGSVFSPAGLERQLGDLQWVERTARAHDAVINAAATSTTTLPLRLGTTCADDDSVVALLVDLESAALRTFDRLDGRREWGVRLLARTASPRSTGSPASKAAESGTSFLTRRRAELQQQAGAGEVESDDAQTVYAALAPHAVEASRHPTNDRAGVMGPGRRTVLNAAFLVDTAGNDAFLAAARELQAQLGDDRLIVSGPWAAYSFVDLGRP